MQAQQTSRPIHDCGQFYRDSAEYPEQLKFRRFVPQWSKKLYDDVEELLGIERELNDGIAELRRRGGQGPLTMLEFPRILVEGDPTLSENWMRYENKLRTYAQDLCLVHSLYKLPHHGSYANTTLNNNHEIFENGIFCPTNEGDATAYQSQDSRDFVAVVGVDSYDFLMNLAVNRIAWIDTKIFDRLRRLFCMGAGSGHIRLSTLNAFFDTIACILVPLLLTAMMFALARISRLMVRIAVVGIFGLIFSALAMLLSGGQVSRSTTFSLSAAYFAVASVFVSTTGESA